MTMGALWMVTATPASAQVPAARFREPVPETGQGPSPGVPATWLGEPVALPEPGDWPASDLVPPTTLVPADSLMLGPSSRAGAPPEFELNSRAGVRWGGAAVDLTVANLGMWAWNRYVRRAEWAQVSPASWKQNIERGMEWDTDRWLDNQILHPIHGSLYYMAGRANGFGFWGSIPMTATGSVLWEYFAESKQPALNDVLMTTGAGVVLGEAGYRLASLVIDESATGLERIGRELLALFASPGLALHRTTRGKLARSADPLPRRTTTYGAILGFGALHQQATTVGSGGHAIARGHLTLGNPMSPGPVQPFDYLEGTIEVNSVRGLSELSAWGVLGRLDQSLGSTGGYALSGTTHFEMLDLASLQYAAPGAGLSLRGMQALGSEWVLDGSAGAAGLPIVAMTTDNLAPQVRSYDFTAGFEARLAARVRRGTLSLEAQAGTGRFWPLDATSTGQTLHRLSAEARVPLLRGWAAVVRGRAFERRGTYPGQAATRVRTTQVDLVLARVIQSEPPPSLPAGH